MLLRKSLSYFSVDWDIILVSGLQIIYVYYLIDLTEGVCFLLFMFAFVVQSRETPPQNVSMSAISDLPKSSPVRPHDLPTGRQPGVPYSAQYMRSRKMFDKGPSLVSL